MSVYVCRVRSACRKYTAPGGRGLPSLASRSHSPDAIESADRGNRCPSFDGGANEGNTRGTIPTSLSAGLPLRNKLPASWESYASLRLLYKRLYTRPGSVAIRREFRVGLFPYFLFFFFIFFFGFSGTWDDESRKVSADTLDNRHSRRAPRTSGYRASTAAPGRPQFDSVHGSFRSFRNEGNGTGVGDRGPRSTDFNPDRAT